MVLLGSRSEKIPNLRKLYKFNFENKMEEKDIKIAQA